MRTQYHFSSTSWNSIADNFHPHYHNSPLLSRVSRNWATFFQTVAPYRGRKDTGISPPLLCCREVERRRWKNLTSSQNSSRWTGGAANIALHGGTRDINSQSTRRAETDSQSKSHLVPSFSPGHPPAASLDLLTPYSIRTACLNAIYVLRLFYFGASL